MANIPLKSIKFPDLPDTYVIQPSVADVDGLQDELDQKADVNGSYDDMTVGNAEQLHSTVGATDTEPFSFRTSGGSLNIGDREELTLVGVDVGWNQLVKCDRGYYSQNGITATNNGDGSLTINGTAEANGSIVTDVNYISTPINHVFYFGGYKKIGSNAGFFGVAGYSIDKGGGALFKNTSTYTSMPPRIDYVAGDSFSNVKMYPQVIDLTALLDSTIVDYISTLEQSTAGSGVAFFTKYFGTGYKAYDGGSLQSPVVKGIKMTGFNQWDEEWRNGYYDLTTGEFKPSANYVCNTNAIKVLPNTTYCITAPSGVNHPIFFYDDSGNFISRSGTNFAGVQTFTTPSNCGFVAFFMDTPYGTTYKNDICINLHWDGERDGEYEPYEEHYYPISPEPLHGIMTIEDGKLKADGDIRHADGTIDRWFTYRNYESGDESLANAITDGVHTSVKKQTPTTDTADPFTTPMIVDDWGTEEFIYNDGTTKFVPVGHSTKYLPNLKAKLEMSPDSPSGDGVYVVEQVSGINTYIPLASADTITSIITRIEALENA